MSRGVNAVTGLCACGEPPVCAEELAVIRELVERGHSFRAVAAKLDRDPTTVALHARRLGLASAHKRIGRAA